MTRIEREVLAKMGDSWKEATPGLRVQAYHAGRKIVDLAEGQTFSVYDWASVTKIVFTVTALMLKVDEGVLRVQDPISRWVPWFPEENPGRVSDLLCHSAGMTWWYPFYRELVRKVPARAKPEEAWEIFTAILRKRVLADLKKNPRLQRTPPPKTVYSDLDFFMLGITLESLSGTSLYTVWDEVRERMGLEHTDFLRGNKPHETRKDYAPTEKDTTFRHKQIRGEVHDQNTWSLKGVAPHAGLFGPIDDLSRYGLLLRSAMRGKKSRSFATPATVAAFTKRALPRARGDWALGFMMPTKGSASCGDLFSMKSVGHTGFTGTSLWYDPSRDLLVTILTNRVYPTIENIKIRELRPRLHTWIAESI